MTVKVVDKSANKFTVDGETANAVPADGSGGGGALTAPLPHEPRNTEQQADNSRAAPCWNILFIFTKTPFPVLRHHGNNSAKVLASVRILTKCPGRDIILAACAVRHSPLSIYPGPTKLLHRAITGAMMDLFRNSLSVSACWGASSGTVASKNCEVTSLCLPVTIQQKSHPIRRNTVSRV